MTDFYFYCETAFHHQGDADYLRALITASKDAGANGVKFQVLTNVNDFISSMHSAYQDLSGYCFTHDQWKEIFAFTKDLGLDIIMMPLNVESLRLATEFEVKYLEIHSVSFNDFALHEKIREAKTDLILGVGGRTDDEIRRMQEYFGLQLKMLMFGFQSFPSKLEDLKLGKIAYLRTQFPSLEIGYGDHSSFDHEHAVISNEYAYLLGARAFEKHITIDEGVERVDFSAAVSKDKIGEIIRRLSFLRDHIFPGENKYSEFNEAELRYRNRQLICVAAHDISESATISENDIKLKLIDTTEEIFTIPSEIIGKKAIAKIGFDQPFIKSNLA